jgi:thiol-disulfide isomerase/thioredoxin
VDGKPFTDSSFEDAKVLVVLFICNHCPYVKAVEDRIIALARDYKGKGAQVVGVCSNDPTDYPDDAPPKLLERWKSKNYGFPYLVDESQDVARAFGAVCTPDIFVYGPDRALAYRGRIDDSPHDPSKVKKQELRAAIDALLAGKQPGKEQVASMGCSVKWRKGT